MVFSNGRFEDDVTSIALYDADHRFVDASMAAGYLRIFDKTSQIPARLRAAIIASAVPEEVSVQRMKRHVSPGTVVYLDLPETGTFAACSDWQIGKPRRYWPLPGIELRIVGGHIAIRSEGIARPQYGDADGWFHSALAGSLAPDGALLLA